MNLKTDGIIIREQTTGEQDRLVTVLTREKGIIKAFVNGARNPRNKNVGATGLFCYSDFSIIKTKKDVYIISEASSIEVFFSLRENIINLALAQYIAELTYELAPREEKADEFLSLTLNAIFLISKNKKDLRLLKCASELRMLTLAGYMPNLIGCTECGKYEDEEMYFDFKTGNIFCSECEKGNHQKISLSVLCAMRYICFSPAKKIYSFTLPKNEMETLSYISERYLKGITSRSYKTLEFYKSMTLD